MSTPPTFDRVSWPLRTDRLTLRPATTDDLPAVFAVRTQEEVGRWMPDRPATYADFLLRLGRHEALGRTLVMELDGLVIGDLYLHVTDGWGQREVADRARGAQAEIGWCLDPAHQGHGYVTEAMTEIVRLCFADLGVRRLTAAAFADNTPSLAVMRRLGMRAETLGVRDSLHRDLGWVDGVVYALLLDEWHAQH